MNRSKISIAIILVFVTIGLIAVVSKTNNQVEIHQLDLQTKQQELDLLKNKLELNEQTKAKTQQELDAKLKENQKLQSEIERLQAIKEEKARIAQAQERNVAQASPQAVSAPTPMTGDWVAQCHAWASQAGIVLNDSAIKLLERESHCSPTAQNPTSSACGIAQNINGCGSAGYGYDPISQLIWFHNYCQSRYGGFDGALAHSLAKGWY